MFVCSTVKKSFTTTRLIRCGSTDFPVRKRLNELFIKSHCTAKHACEFEHARRWGSVCVRACVFVRVCVCMCVHLCVCVCVLCGPVDLSSMKDLIASANHISAAKWDYLNMEQMRCRRTISRCPRFYVTLNSPHMLKHVLQYMLWNLFFNLLKQLATSDGVSKTWVNRFLGGIILQLIQF